MFCAGRVPEGDLKRTMKACGGAIMTTAHDINDAVLGTCERFEEKQIGGERYADLVLIFIISFKCIIFLFFSYMYFLFFFACNKYLYLYNLHLKSPKQRKGYRLKNPGVSFVQKPPDGL